MDYNYTFSKDLTLNRIPFGAKSIRKVELETKFDLA